MRPTPATHALHPQQKILFPALGLRIDRLDETLAV
jgi:hypothetical protein